MKSKEVVSMGDKVDVIIPVYKPGESFKDVLRKILKQTVPPDHIFLLQTVESDNDKLIKVNDERVNVYPIKKSEFDHGGTRRYGVSLSKAEYVLLMTQDAVPQDDRLIENLLKAFDDETGVSYGRQLAREGADIVERMTREFNYPAQSIVKTKKDLDRLGIKTFFCSDVCAMYKKSIYDELGGFVKKTIFNEDMIMASKIINSGYKVVYAADAQVIHSHSYTCRQQFVRNFDLGVSQRQYKEVFEGISSEKEGKGYAKKILLTLLKGGHFIKAFYFAMQCGFKLFGYKLGLRYDRMSKKMILKCTMNKGYWE